MDRPDVIDRSPELPRIEGGRTFLARIWWRLPVVVRAILVGWLVLTAGNLPSGPVEFANLKPSGLS